MQGFEILGIELTSCNIGLDQFNEHQGFLDPDGQPITLLEARTYSPVHESELKPSVCGYFLEYRIPVHDLEASTRFWESLGLIVTPREDGVLRPGFLGRHQPGTEPGGPCDTSGTRVQPPGAG